MIRKSGLFCFAVLLAIQAIFVGKAVSAESLARLHVSGALVEWLPQVASEELVLRLAGPDGEVRSWSFPPGSVPSRSLFDDKGQPLPDGLYTYELWATPRLSPKLRERLRSARAAGDEAAVQRLQNQIPLPLVQDGTFRILGGTILAGDKGEAETRSLLKDQVVPDDLIVDGKGCIGLGCANGESFGAEALKLKQSVVRLRFEDTSTTAGFPTRDWQLTANDAGSGGADRFSIEDLTAGRTPLTIRGNAPDNALFVDANGKVGLRTATPAQDVHIASGNTPAVRLEQTAAGGFPARTWDVIANDTAFAVKDVTNASAIPFRVEAGAATGSLEIATTGFVGLGTTSPTTRLHLRSTDPTTSSFAAGKVFIENASSTTAPRELFEARNNGSPAFIFKDTTEAERWSIGTWVHQFIIENQAHAGVEFSFGSTGNLTITGVLTQSSDRAVKESLSAVVPGEVLSKLSSLPLFTWNFIQDPAKAQHLGPMAQDFRAAFGLGEDERHIAPSDLAGVTLAAVQGLNMKVEEQQRIIKEQQELIQHLAERLARLEGKR
ncbi:MAG TPA: tail fiber domain-containing protein [Thermoanaerobaculia bacterium]|nr:tail fiber domain-containing protein [Thermoanaerobaculia bacterium]